MSNSSLIENNSFTCSFTITDKSNSSNESNVELIQSERTVDDLNDVQLTESNASLLDSMSYDSLTSYPSRPGLSHSFNAFNNAAQSTRRVKSPNKRSFLLRGLFGRSSSKKQTSISGGDYIKSTKKQTDYDVNVKEDRFEGLRYDFQQIKASSNVSTPDSKSPPTNSQMIHPPLGQSLSSLSDPTSIRHFNIERKQPIQSAHATMNMVKMTNTTDKSLFNANQHKYQTQTPVYQHPKPLSAVENLAKKYGSAMVPRTSTGLFWHSANHNTISPNRLSFSNTKNRLHLSATKSSASIDTSSDSNTSDSDSNSTNDATISASTSRSSSTSNTHSISTSADTTTVNKQVKSKKKDLIQIDLNSTASQTSLSNKSSSTSTTSSSSTASTNTNGNTRSSKMFDIFSSGQKTTMGKFKVKRQRIETSIDR